MMLTKKTGHPEICVRFEREIVSLKRSLWKDRLRQERGQQALTFWGLLQEAPRCHRMGEGKDG